MWLVRSVVSWTVVWSGSLGLVARDLGFGFVEREPEEDDMVIFVLKVRFGRSR